jgi:hypothetical protein
MELIIDSTEELEKVNEIKLSKLDNKSLILDPSRTPVSISNIKKLIYCSVSIHEIYFSEIIKLVTKYISRLEEGPIFDKWNNSINKNNRELHSTVLFCSTGVDKTDLIEQLNPYFGLQINVNIISIAISMDYITLGIDFEDKIPYFQNPIKHITD